MKVDHKPKDSKQYKFSFYNWIDLFAKFKILFLFFLRNKKIPYLPEKSTIFEYRER